MVLYFLLFLVILLIAPGFYLSQKVLYIPIKTDDKILEYETNNNAFDKQWFETLKKEKVIIRSPFGYQLDGFFIPSENPDGKTVIFCHGVSVNYLCSVKYARMFLRKGWNVFIYDHRRHGKSEGKMTGFGFYEKQDLQAIVKYVRKRLEQNAVLGLHGESMGAATILQYGGLEDNVDFYIADCAFSSLWRQLTHLLNTKYHLPVFPLMYITNFFVIQRGKFRIKDVNPLENVKKIDKPVLFIHGDSDTYVPTAMSVEMFEVKTGVKELYLAPGAAHAKSMMVDPEKYEDVVFSFLQKAGISV